MNALTTLTRVAALGLGVVAFTGTALADPGNGNGSPATTPPGQEKKAGEPAAAPTATPTQAPAPKAAAAPGQEKRAEKQTAKAAKKAEPKPAAAAAKGQAKKAEKQAAKDAKQAEQKPATAKGRSAEAHHHVIVCHRTGSDSNPYVVINIPWTAWSEAHSPDTGSHPDLNGRHDIMLKDPASRPGSKDGFTKEDCEAAAGPAPQQQTDVCPNIEQNQDQVPPGHMKDEKGNCVQVQAQQQVDVCPNLEGMQATVPSGLLKDTSGNCVAPPAPTTVVVEQAPAGQVKGVATPAAPKAKAAAPKAKPAKEKPAGGVLGAVASAPEAIAETATQGELPFTGIPLWIAALIGGALLATGLVLRRATAAR